jgi:hypothetical protein
MFIDNVFSDFFSLFFVYLLYIARRRVCDDEEIVSILDIVMKICQTLFPVIVIMK